MWHLSGCVIAFGSHTAIGIEELSAPSFEIVKNETIGFSEKISIC